MFYLKKDESTCFMKLKLKESNPKFLKLSLTNTVDLDGHRTVTMVHTIYFFFKSTKKHIIKRKVDTEDQSVPLRCF